MGQCCCKDAPTTLTADDVEMQGYSVMRPIGEPAEPQPINFDSASSEPVGDALDHMSSSSSSSSSNTDEESFSLEDRDYYASYTPVKATGPPPAQPRPQDVMRADYEMRLGVQQSTLSRRRHLIRAYETHKYTHFAAEGVAAAQRYTKLARNTRTAVDERRRYYSDALRHTNDWPEKKRLKEEYNVFWATYGDKLTAVTRVTDL